MSTSTQTDAQPTADEAQALLLKRAFIDPFFDRLAQYGIVADNEPNKVALLQIGQTLLDQEVAQQQKQASELNPLLARSLQKLGAAAPQQRYGFGSDEQWQQITNSLVNDKTVAHAVLALTAPGVAGELIQR